MKGLKVKRIKTLIMSISILFTLTSFSAINVVYCPILQVDFECIDQDNGLYSLEGQFQDGSDTFSLTLRRAIEKDLCHSTINLFRSIMKKSDNFCINGETIKDYPFDITLNSISSNNKIMWKYFK